MNFLFVIDDENDFGDFFTKRIKIPPPKYVTETDTLKNNLEDKNKKKKSKKNVSKLEAERQNRKELLDEVSSLQHVHKFIFYL